MRFFINLRSIWEFDFHFSISPSSVTNEFLELTSSLAHDAASVTPDAFVAAVVDLASSHTDVAEYQKNGNIKIASNGDIFIYS